MAYEKTWSFSLNNTRTTFASVAEQAAYVAWLWKALITGQTGSWSPTTPTTGFWTCVGSSDASTAGLDGADRWGSTFDLSKIVRAAAGVAHSWIVLRSPALAFNGYTVEVCLDFGTTQDYFARSIHSIAGFTGGSTTARPTATDEVAYNAGSSTVVLLTNSSLYTAANYHAALTSDGSWYFLQNPSASYVADLSLMCIEPSSVHPSDTFPVFFARNYSPNTPNPAPETLSAVNPSDSSIVYTRLANGTLGANRALASGVRYSPALSVDLLLQKQLYVPYWIVADSPTVWHMRGRLPDIYICPVGSDYQRIIGRTLREAGVITHFVCGSLLLPANSQPNFI